MGADDYVDRPVGKPVASFLGLLGSDEAAEAAHLEREAREAIAEVLEMLAREQGRRRDHRDLLAVHRRDEGGAQRNLGLAEADVAADQAVHRLAFGQVGQHVLDRAFLVVGFVPREAVDELGEGGFFDREHRRLAQRARGGGAQQVVGDFADALLEPRLAPLPAFAAEAVERDQLLRRAVAREDVDVLDRDEQLVAAGVFEPDAIVLALADGDRFEPKVLADAVVHVDHEVAAVERGQLGEEGVGILALLAPADEAVAEQVLLGEQVDLVVRKAGIERQDQRHRALGGQAERFLPAVGQPGLGARFLEDRHDAAARAGGIGGEQRLAAVLRDDLEVRGRGFVDVVAARALGGEIARRPEPEVEHCRAFGLGEDIGAVDRPGFEAGGEFFARQVQRAGVERAVIPGCVPGHLSALAVVILNVLETLVRGGQRGGIDDDQVVLAEMVEQRRQPVLEQRQPVLHARPAGGRR